MLKVPPRQCKLRIDSMVIAAAADEIAEPFLKRDLVSSPCGECESKLIGCFGLCPASRYRQIIENHSKLLFNWMVAKAKGSDGEREWDKVQRDLIRVAALKEFKRYLLDTVHLPEMQTRTKNWLKDNLDSAALDACTYSPINSPIHSRVHTPETLSLASEILSLQEEPIMKILPVEEPMPPIQTQTTTEYRNWRQEIGLPLEYDQHVGHIIAKTNGGADHQDNYYPISAWINVSVGNRDDSFLAMVAGLEATRKAVAVSKRLRGYNGPSAEELVEIGKKRHKSWQS